MTTKVTVEACCAADIEVVVTVGEGDQMQETVIQDGETHEEYVYDDRRVTVMERSKSVDAD